MKFITKLPRVITSMSLVLAIAFPVFAADYNDETMPAQPADLHERKSSLQNRIQFPDFEEDVFLLLLCDSVISDRGDFIGQVYCYRDVELEESVEPGLADARNIEFSPNPDIEEIEVTAERNDWLAERFEREVVEASRSSQLDPARLEGKRAEVKVNFSVRFEKKSGVESIDVYMHHFRNFEVLGTDYIAAQRFNGQKRLFESARPNDCPEIHVPVWIKAYVETSGSAYRAALFDAGDEEGTSMDAIDRCVVSFNELIETNLFVPTIFYGQYISGTYIELFYDDVRDENAVTSTDTRDRLVSEFQARGEEIEGLGTLSTENLRRP